MGNTLGPLVGRKYGNTTPPDHNFATLANPKGTLILPPNTIKK